MKNKKIKLNDKGIVMDLEELMRSKLLVQANSGGGKSWTVRRILEQSHGQVQQIIIDPEGEYSNLREKYDYILAGKGGDIPAEPRHAEVLARKLLEHNTSAIIDLYELHPQERKHFVKLFLNAMLNAPKELQHACMIVIDEAHVFAPEAGQSESLDAVIGLAATGRKRQFSAIFATQRISKLHKDVAAECNNKLVGRTGLDIDQKRAGDDLGFRTNEQRHELRNLESGEFYAYGPALSRDVIKFKIGDVNVKPPKNQVFKMPKASGRIKEILAKLGDIPAEAVKESNTIDSLKKEVQKLKGDLVSEKKVKATISQEPKTVYVHDKRETEKIVSQRDKEWAKIVANWKGFALYCEKAFKSAVDESERKYSLIDSHMPIMEAPEDKIFTITGNPLFSKENLEKAIKSAESQLPEKGSTLTRAMAIDFVDINGNTIKPLSKGAKSIIAYLHSVYPNEKNKTQIWVATGYSPGGGFNNMIYELTGKEFIIQSGKGYKSHENYTFLVDEFTASLDIWRNKLGTGPRKIFDLMLQDTDKVWTKEELATLTGYALGGGFNNNIYTLTGAELIKKEGTGYIINPDILNL